MGFLEAKTTLGFKIESTPYTAETLAASDYNLAAFNIKFSPEIAMFARKLSRGDFSRDVAIPGKRKGKISFSISVGRQGAAATAPTYFGPMRACGMKQTTYSTTGVGLTPGNGGYTNVPATIEVVMKDEGASPSQVVVKFRGCMGNVKIVLDKVGEPMRLDFDFEGIPHTASAVSDRAFGSILTPTGYDSPLPDAVLSTTINMFGESQYVDKFTIDLGNKLEAFTDHSKAEGHSGVHIVDREVKMTLDPDLVLVATQGDYQRWITPTTGTLSIVVGQAITLSAPAIQYEKAYEPGSREGKVTNNKSMIMTRSAGSDEFEFLQGSKS